ALAARNAGARIRTFNIGFDEARYDESAHARAVARALGTEHHELRLTQEAFRREVPDALASLDQPTFDAINTYFVSRAVREAGLTVALAGTGGDELFGGYTSFRDVPWAARWSRRFCWLPRELLRRVGDGVMRAAAARDRRREHGQLPRSEGAVPRSRGRLGRVRAFRRGSLRPAGKEARPARARLGRSRS